MGSIFDILGPVMVGPSSSHTAGAARIGYTARQLFDEPVKKAEVYLHGSFAATGKGHGTDRAIIAGLLGMKPDDLRIPVAFEEAKKAGMEFTIANRELKCTSEYGTRCDGKCRRKKDGTSGIFYWRRTYPGQYFGWN